MPYGLGVRRLGIAIDVSHSGDQTCLDVIRYRVELVGAEHVTFGPDTLFGDHVGLHEAFAEQLSIAQARGDLQFLRVDYVDGLENPAACFGSIIGWLVAHDWSDDEIRAVVGGRTLPENRLPPAEPVPRASTRRGRARRTPARPG